VLILRGEQHRCGERCATGTRCRTCRHDRIDDEVFERSLVGQTQVGVDDRTYAVLQQHDVRDVADDGRDLFERLLHQLERARRLLLLTR
jgi:hypothetical protein